MPQPVATIENLRTIFARHGLPTMGVTPAERLPDEEARYAARLQAGQTADMAYLSRHAPLKFAPTAILRGCRSVLVTALGYYQGERRGRPGSPAGRVARYAWGRDYHDVLGGRLTRVARELERLMPGERFLPAVDATPLAECRYAERAGLGAIGRNGLLCDATMGSWMVLGEILTTVRVPEAMDRASPSTCPVGCRRCMDACPTGALVEPGVLDARRCLSYHTIENRRAIPEDLRPRMGDRLFGCDACQEACPRNHGVSPMGRSDLLGRLTGPTLDLVPILGLRDGADLARRLPGTPLTRAGRRGLVRNACIVAGNLGDPGLLGALRPLTRDADEVVAEHAAWAVSRATRGVAAANA